MSATAVIGLQWGDEAKGKFVDLLTDEHEIVVRYLGGNNAGHTVVRDGQTYKLSLMPAGILSPHVTSVIATGVVIHPESLLGEISHISERLGSPEGRLLISDRAHVIFPYHMREEAILEGRRQQGEAIGTTMRGIGTCYRDKYSRSHAIRMGDLLRPPLLRKRLREIVADKNVLLAAFDPDHEPFDADALCDEYVTLGERLRPYVTDTTAFLLRAVAEKKRLLFEGAQGSLLDIDHGTFPYVTSSNSSNCGIHPGSGVPERYIDRLLGVVKAYTTRVGGGPFVTELNDDQGQKIRDRGNEYGTVTGRPRRCGWFDAVAARYTARLSGVDQIAVALLDVLDDFSEIQICEAYEIDGERISDFPSHADDLARAKPVYRTLPGWNSDTTGIRRREDLPEIALKYLDAISNLVEAPLAYVGVGPDREQTIVWHCS